MQQKTLSYCKFPEICADKESKDVHWVSLYEKYGIRITLEYAYA